jgi:hypothetical protein
VARRLEAEGVDVRRQVEVVVDRLRHVHDVDAAGGRSSSFIAENAVSSPPIVMSCETFRRSSEMTVFSRCCGFLVGFAREMPMCEPPRKWMRLTVVDRQRRHVVDVALHDPLEAVADAEHLDALEHGRGSWRRR